MQYSTKYPQPQRLKVNNINDVERDKIKKILLTDCKDTLDSQQSLKLQQKESLKIEPLLPSRVFEELSIILFTCSGTHFLQFRWLTTEKIGKYRKSLSTA